MAATKARKRKPQPAAGKPPLRLEWLDPADLDANPLNWRRHPEPQTAALRAALNEVGWAGALLYNERTKRLIDGHARKEIKSGERVPVLVGSWSEDDERKILATLDPLAAMATADTAALDALLKSVSVGDEALRGMLAELGAANPPPLPEAGGGGDDFDATPQDGPTRTQRGELWLIRGNGLEHRLLVGDCTNEDDVRFAMRGEKAGLMTTDPPYGVEYDTEWREDAGVSTMGPQSAKGIKWDANADWSGAFKLFGGNVAYVWHADACHTVVADSLVAAGFEVRQQIIWNKTVMVMGRANYHFKHEPCWYAVRKGKDANWLGDRTQTTVWDAASPRHLMGGSDEEKTPHPTQKPIELSTVPILNHTKPDGLVYDPFLGSGTTLIAAHRLGRRCYGLEIEPRYADVILKRAEAEGLTCEKAA